MTSCFKGRFKVTSPRGYRTLRGRKEYHSGIDIVALEDKTVYAVSDGAINAVLFEPNGFGHYVRQTLPDGRRIYYGHMLAGSIVVKAGQKIRKGDKLGVMGSSGNSTGAHTHIELRVKGTSRESLDISDFTGIPNKVGTYFASESKETDADTVQRVCGFTDGTMDYLKKYKYSDSLFEKLAQHIK